MSCSGTMGKVSIVPDRIKTGIINQALLKITPGNNIDVTYLRHWMESPNFQQQLAAMSFGAAIKNVASVKILKGVKIPLPPLEEQRRIAAILDQADALRRLRHRTLTHLNTLAQSIFHEMFGDPNTNPKGWDTKPLSDVGRLDRGVSKHRPRNEPALLGGDHPLIQTGDVSRAGDFITTYSSTYSDLGLAQSRMWRKGTVCITIAANIADTAILDFDACFPDSVVGFDAEDDARNFFVHRWFATIKGKLEAIAPAVAQKNINLRILRELPIIAPPNDLVQEFFDRELEIKAGLAKGYRHKGHLEGLFTSLQHRAFCGEL